MASEELLAKVEEGIKQVARRAVDRDRNRILALLRDCISTDYETRLLLEGLILDADSAVGVRFTLTRQTCNPFPEATQMQALCKDCPIATETSLSTPTFFGKHQEHPFG